MPTISDWRLPRAAESLNGLDRAGFAWEFLRRNPQYRADYGRIDLQAMAGRRSPAAIGKNWGLSFRLQPRALRSAGSRNLATGTAAQRRCPDRHAA